jgi:hypothetical protein
LRRLELRRSMVMYTPQGSSGKRCGHVVPPSRPGQAARNASSATPQHSASSTQASGCWAAAARIAVNVISGWPFEKARSFAKASAISASTVSSGHRHASRESASSLAVSNRSCGFQRRALVTTIARFGGIRSFVWRGLLYPSAIDSPRITRTRSSSESG